jgi:hypothetical protein
MSYEDGNSSWLHCRIATGDVTRSAVLSAFNAGPRAVERTTSIATLTDTASLCGSHLPSEIRVISFEDILSVTWLISTVVSEVHYEPLKNQVVPRKRCLIRMKSCCFGSYFSEKSSTFVVTVTRTHKYAVWVKLRVLYVKVFITNSNHCTSNGQ